MPNWCENYLIFMSNGTPQGDLAIQDFHDKLINASKCRNKYGKLWEYDAESFIFGLDACNGLYKEIPFPKRGYITDITDVNYNSFHVVSYDAWAANNSFWLVLLNTIYGDLISFTYIASEPGVGFYYTNDTGFLPRYNAKIYTDNISELMNIPGAWNPDLSDNLFKYLNTDNPYIDCTAIRNNAIYPYMYFDSEGDSDEVIEAFKDYIFGEDLSDIKDIPDLINKLENSKINYNLNDYEYIPLEDEVRQSIIFNEVMKNNGKSFNVQDVNNEIDKYSKQLGMYIEHLD